MGGGGWAGGKCGTSYTTHTNNTTDKDAIFFSSNIFCRFVLPMLELGKPCENCGKISPFVRETALPMHFHWDMLRFTRYVVDHAWLKLDFFSVREKNKSRI